MTTHIKTEAGADDPAPSDPMAVFTAQLAFIKTKPKAKPDYRAAWYRKQKPKAVD